MKWLRLAAAVLAPLVICASCGDSGGTASATDAGTDVADTGTTNDGPSGLDGGSDAPADVKGDADAAPPLIGKYLWAKRFGNDANGSVGGQVAVDGSGNIVVAGGFTQSVDFGGGLFTSAGSIDVFVAKFDSTGKHLWSKRFGDPGLQNADQPAIDASGNIFVVGGFEGTVNFGGSDLTSAGGEDAFVAKFDANGNHLWSKRFGGVGTEVCSGVAVSGSNIVLLGTFTSTIDFGGGGLTPAPSQFLATLTGAAGDHVWSKVPANVTATTVLYQEHVRVDGAGNIVFAGGFSGSIDFGDGALTASGEDIFVAKFAAGGSYTWSKRFGSSAVAQHIAKDLALDKTGNILLTGESSNAIDFGSGPVSPGVFVAKFGGSGSAAWAKGFSFTNGNANGVAVDAYGDAVITGNYSGQVDFGGGPLALHDGSNGTRAGYVAKFDVGGLHAWSRGWDAQNASAGSPAFDSEGNLLVAGGFTGTVNLGGGPLASTSSAADMLLAKFAP